MGTRTAALPISTCAPIPPDQILRSNPAVPITIAALVIAVVDSTIITEDPSHRDARRAILTISKLTKFELAARG